MTGSTSFIILRTWGGADVQKDRLKTKKPKKRPQIGGLGERAGANRHGFSVWVTAGACSESKWTNKSRSTVKQSSLCLLLSRRWATREIGQRGFAKGLVQPYTGEQGRWLLGLSRVVRTKKCVLYGKRRKTGVFASLSRTCCGCRYLPGRVFGAWVVATRGQVGRNWLAWYLWKVGGVGRLPTRAPSSE